MNDTPPPESLLYDFPGRPVHPADLMMAKMIHESRMRQIRELDIEAWVAEVRR